MVNSRKNTFNRKTWLIVGVVLLLAIATLVILEAANVTHIFHKANTVKTFEKTPTKGGASVNNGKGESSTTTPPDTGNTSQPGDDKSSTGGDTTATLITPSADSLVSNHHPSLSNPALSSVSSVCTTTPGASCTISFTKDGITQSLASQTADRGGSVYWNNWTLQDKKLTAGSWTIQATATLNGQTKSASDAMPLVVSP